MNKKQLITIILSGIVLLVIGIFIGRYLSSETNNKVSIVTSTPAVVESEDTTPQTSQTQASESAPQKKTDPHTVCVNDLEKKVRDEKKTYVKGSILVTFKSGTSRENATEILSSYNASTQSASSYDSLRLITAGVPQDKEFEYICTIKNNSSVQYVGLNETFSIHQ